MLGHLRQELALITETINTLERLIRGQGKRRGRPPKWLTEPAPKQTEGPKRRGRPPGSKNRKKSASGENAG